MFNLFFINHKTYLFDNHQDHRDFRNNPERNAHTVCQYILLDIYIRVHRND